MYIETNGFSKCLRVSSLQLVGKRTCRSQNCTVRTSICNSHFRFLVYWSWCRRSKYVATARPIATRFFSLRCSMLAGSLSLQSLRRCLCGIWRSWYLSSNRYLSQTVVVLLLTPNLWKSEDYAWFCWGGLLVELYDALHQLHVLLSQVLPSQLVEVVVKQSVARRECRRSDGEWRLAS